MDKFVRGLKPREKEWVHTSSGVKTLEDAINMAQKVSAFSTEEAVHRAVTPPRAPLDAMEIDAMQLHALSTRRPKDRRDLYHEHVEDPRPYPPVPHRAQTPGPHRPQGNGYGGPYGPPDPPRQQQLPPLTIEERQYLILNHGCFKCRQLGHWVSECPLNQTSGRPQRSSTPFRR